MTTRFPCLRSLAAAGALLAIGACASRQAGSAPHATGAADDLGFRRASTLPDLSGLVWIGGDRFLAVHDSKFPEEADRPRVSLLEVSGGPEGILWNPLPVVFPTQPSSDLESAARIPGEVGGRVRVLLVESGEEVSGQPLPQRLFLAEVEGESVEIVDHAVWPVGTRNIEATAVADVGGTLLLLYAERAHGEGSTEFLFAEIELDPFHFGTFESAGAFTSPGPTGPIARPVTALEIDASGAIYVASSEDPDDDDGPFRSAVYRIGRVSWVDGRASVVLDAAPTLLGVLDGLKVEGLAVRERPGEVPELWVGVDDENYGGTMRPLPARSAGAP
jgi:hypothetical protein